MNSPADAQRAILCLPQCSIPNVTHSLEEAAALPNSFGAGADVTVQMKRSANN